MDIAAFVVSLFALTLAGITSYRSYVVARQGNGLPVLIDLFREHRSDRLASARQYVHSLDMAALEVRNGFKALPAEKEILVRDLAWFYDNLGVLVAHDVLEVEPVAGYLGGSVIDVWRQLEPLVQAERERRRPSSDAGRFQEYFENLAALLESRVPPERARASQRLWVLSGGGEAQLMRRIQRRTEAQDDIA